MRLLTFWADGVLHAGVRDGDEVRDGGPVAALQADAEAWRGLGRTAGRTMPLASLRLGPCLPVPGKLICVGLNYRRHAEESGAEVPSTPILFSKFSNSLAAHEQEISLSDAAREYDYEAELGVVIGRRCRNVAERDALDFVFGYCATNDVSARDLQFRTSQWLLGKSLDGFLPVGPELVTAEEVGDPQDLRIRCSVNGELRQNSTTADMIFSVREIVSYLSKYMTLDPGDFIATGTPEGVIAGMSEKRWLVAGDQVEVEIDKLGRLRNRFV